MYNIKVNGIEYQREDDKKLLPFLRDDLGLTSAKDGCSEGACGTCTVLVDGKKVRACIFTLSKLDGKSVVTVKSADGWKPIPFHDVKYLEAKNRKTHVIANDHHGTHKNTLQEFEYILPRDSFIRCHRSFIVNVHHIEEIFPDTHSTLLLAMNDGSKIPVSQSYSSYFRKLLGF